MQEVQNVLSTVTYWSSRSPAKTVSRVQSKSPSVPLLARVPCFHQPWPSGLSESCYELS